MSMHPPKTREELLQSYHTVRVACDAATQSFTAAGKEWTRALISRDSSRIDKTYKLYDKARQESNLRSTCVWDFSEKGSRHTAVMREYSAARERGLLRELLHLGATTPRTKARGRGDVAVLQPVFNIDLDSSEKKPKKKTTAKKQKAKAQTEEEEKKGAVEERVTPWTIAKKSARKARRVAGDEPGKRKRRVKAIASSTQKGLPRARPKKQAK